MAKKSGSTHRLSIYFLGRLLPAPRGAAFLLMGLLPFNMDNGAHIGGLATGLVVTYLAGFPSLFMVVVGVSFRPGHWGGSATPVMSAQY